MAPTSDFWLPVELVKSIIDATDDWAEADLCRFCLVNSDWCSLARPLLYETVYIQPRVRTDYSAHVRRSKLLARTLTTNSRLGQWPKRLSVAAAQHDHTRYFNDHIPRDAEMYHDFAEDAVGIVQACPAISTLQLGTFYSVETFRQLLQLLVLRATDRIETVDVVRELPPAEGGIFHGWLVSASAHYFKHLVGDYTCNAPMSRGLPWRVATAHNMPLDRLESFSSRSVPSIHVQTGVIGFAACSLTKIEIPACRGPLSRLTTYEALEHVTIKLIPPLDATIDEAVQDLRNAKHQINSCLTIKTLVIKNRRTVRHRREAFARAKFLFDLPESIETLDVSGVLDMPGEHVVAALFDSGRLRMPRLGRLVIGQGQVAERARLARDCTTNGCVLQFRL
ncbi:hypothetical protein ACM66B_005612 [Microbotryomycetes sp. NB124-2]